MIFKKNFFLLFICLSFVMVPFYSVSSLELDESTRTVQLKQDGQIVTLTADQVKRGKRLFNNACAQCHNGIDYMKDPTSYDGESSIAELHPSIKSAEIFPKMRNLTDEDLFAIAGHILIQPKIASEKWGGGKIYY